MIHENIKVGIHQGTSGKYVNRVLGPSCVRVARVLQGQHASGCATSGYWFISVLYRGQFNARTTLKIEVILSGPTSWRANSNQLNFTQYFASALSLKRVCHTGLSLQHVSCWCPATYVPLFMPTLLAGKWRKLSSTCLLVESLGSLSDNGDPTRTSLNKRFNG